MTLLFLNLLNVDYNSKDINQDYGILIFKGAIENGFKIIYSNSSRFILSVNLPSSEWRACVTDSDLWLLCFSSYFIFLSLSLSLSFFFLSFIFLTLIQLFYFRYYISRVLHFQLWRGTDLKWTATIHCATIFIVIIIYYPWSIALIYSVYLIALDTYRRLRL